MSRGDVVVLINKDRQHTVVSMGGSRFIQASGSERRVIIVDINKVNDGSYRFRGLSEKIRNFLKMPHTVYDIHWPR